MLLWSICGCTNTPVLNYTLKKFMNSSVSLPDSVIMVKDGLVSQSKLPSDSLRLVYVYDKNDCYSCAVTHAFDLCNLYNQDIYTPIILFSPPKQKFLETISLIQKAEYDFPIYLSSDDKWLKRSHIPRDGRFHVFLINQDNNPIFVGDPVRSGQSYDLLNDILLDLT